MRARFAIVLSGVEVELREILLTNKPAEMIVASPKGTVPVLILSDGTVIDESIEIMNWAFHHNDMLELKQRVDLQHQLKLIIMNDQSFKYHLDYYKYHVRFHEHSKEFYRHQCETFLTLLESKLSQSRCLFGDVLSFADYAIFPFIRQFANVDTQWFEASNYRNLKRWLKMILELELFDVIMKKYQPWKSSVIQ